MPPSQLGAIPLCRYQRDGHDGDIPPDVFRHLDVPQRVGVVVPCDEQYGTRWRGLERGASESVRHGRGRLAAAVDRSPVQGEREGRNQWPEAREMAPATTPRKLPRQCYCAHPNPEAKRRESEREEVVAFARLAVGVGGKYAVPERRPCPEVEVQRHAKGAGCHEDRQGGPRSPIAPEMPSGSGDA